LINKKGGKTENLFSLRKSERYKKKKGKKEIAKKKKKKEPCGF